MTSAITPEMAAFLDEHGDDPLLADATPESEPEPEKPRARERKGKPEPEPERGLPGNHHRGPGLQESRTPEAQTPEPAKAESGLI